jgi:hypothetical protein
LIQRATEAEDAPSGGALLGASGSPLRGIGARGARRRLGRAQLGEQRATTRLDLGGLGGMSERQRVQGQSWAANDNVSGQSWAAGDNVSGQSWAAGDNVSVEQDQARRGSWLARGGLWKTLPQGALVRPKASDEAAPQRATSGLASDAWSP